MQWLIRFEFPGQNGIDKRSCLFTISSLPHPDQDQVHHGGQLVRRSGRIGFHKKVEIDRVFLDSIREADLMQRDFLPYADDLLILHGTKDEIVPIETVRAFAENNVIEFIPIENADHRFQSPEKMDFAIAKICAFYGLK